MAEIPEPLLRRAADFVVPDHLRAENRRSRFEGLEPASGQVWRARWDETTVLVVILDLSEHEDHRSARAIPLSLEAEYGDETTVVIPPRLSGWPVEIRLWRDVLSDLAFRVLDEPIDTLSQELLKALSPEAEPSDIAKVGLSVAPAPQDDLDEVWRYKAELSDEFAVLASAPALPTGDEHAKDLRSLGFTLSTVMSALDISQPDAMNMLRGKHDITTEQADKLAGTDIGVTPDEVLGAVRPLPTALARALDHPQWKAPVLRKAKQWGVDEQAARRRTAYATYALAARQPGEDWSGRLRRYFEAEGD